MLGVGFDPTLDELTDGLLGIFGAVVISETGTGWVSTDFGSMRCLYRAEDDHRTIISSRAALAAGALAAPGQPDRQLRSAVWLAATGYHVGEGSGFHGVEVLPSRTMLRLEAGTLSWHRMTSPLSVEVDERPVEELAEALVTEIAESLSACLDLPVARRIINLTGGMDSRLVLAAAVRAGIQHEFEYETMGPPDLADVKLAEDLARGLGLRHQALFIGLRPPGSYETRTRTFVERTGGLVNAWDASAPNDADELRITGIGGELLRTFYQLRTPSGARRTVGQMFQERNFRRLGIVREDVAHSLHAEFFDRMATEWAPGSDEFERLDAHYPAHRLRFGRMGPREEVNGSTVRFHPIYSAAAVRLGRALSADDRESGLLFAEVMRGTDEILVRTPFTSGPWAPDVRAYLDSRPPGPAGIDVRPRLGSPVPARTPARVPAEVSDEVTAVPKAESLVQRLFADGSDERVEFVRELVERAKPDAWTWFDREATTTAIDRWDELAVVDRRALFGAATAMAWADEWRGG